MIVEYEEASFTRSTNIGERLATSSKFQVRVVVVALFFWSFPAWYRYIAILCNPASKLFYRHPCRGRPLSVVLDLSTGSSAGDDSQSVPETADATGSSTP